MAIVIDIQLQNKSKTSQLTKTLNVLKQIREELNAIVGLQNSMGNGWRGAPRGGGGGGGGSRSIVPKPPSQLQQFRDAFQQFKFYDQLSKRSNGQMGAQGRQQALGNAQALAQALAQKGNFSPMNQMLPHIMPKMGQTLGQKIKSAIMTTRVGAGAGGLQVAPLVGRLAALHPAIAVATGALALFSEGLHQARSAAMGFAADRATLGGSPQETAAARKAASYLRTDANSLADALKQSIQSGFGASYAAQAGINQVGGPGGDNNYAAKLNKAIQFIMNAPDFETARRRAEGFGMPGAADLYNLSPDQKARLAKAQAMSPEDIKSARNLSVSLAEVSSWIDKFKVGLMGPAMQGIANLTDGFSKLGISAEQVGRAFSLTFMPILGIAKLIGDVINWVREKLKLGPDPETQAQVKAMKENTQAVNGLNRTMNDTRETYGGGRRAGGSLPNKLRGNYIDHNTIQALGGGVRI